MKAASNTNEPSRDDALTRELLLLADGQEIDPPRDVIEGVRAKLHENTVRALSDAPGRATALRTKPAWSAGTGAAAVALIAFIFSLQPSNTAWSQVAQTVRAMPWIRAQVVAKDSRSTESWASFSRNICAIRAGDMIRYDDFRSGIRYEYDAQKKKLFRLSTSGEEQFKSEQEMFRAIFRGDATLGDRFPGHSIVQQRQRTVDEQGRRWILYELEFAEPGNGDSGKTTSVVIRVDPQSLLPDSMTFTRGDEKGHLKIDYPDEGPTDIYALGVPRDTPVEDRTPPPDLDRILKLVEQNRRDFGDYFAVAGGDNRNRHFAVHLVRCKGNKSRIDVGLGDTRHVASGTEMEQWWQEHGRDVMPVGAVLCDGRRLYQRSFVGREAEWKPSDRRIREGSERAAAAGIGITAGHYVDLLAYPSTLSPEELASAPFLTARLDPTGENGPAGSVRVERQIAERGGATDRRTYRKEEFWLQPEYGYAVVKYVISDCLEVNEDPLQKQKQLVHEYDGFRQTPSGVWYPTVSRWKNATQSENKNEPDGIELHDKVTYFYLDFTAELPDGLFSPKWHGDILDGIQFVQRDDQSTANELGKIRPPGGVLLICSRSAIRPESLSRLRQRLEAVPGRELDKWVVELERIMARKLQGELENAGCRSTFVTRLSVAFDGLKWNGAAADNFFQRAQSMLPSEAKSWKEAFETLLNVEIEPAVAVPLVLIPVDALHEGQKYSVDRGRKYRARMKQLTADDVSFWRNKVDEFGGGKIDAAMNIVLLDDYFADGEFQRDKFKAAIEACRPLR